MTLERNKNTDRACTTNSFSLCFSCFYSIRFHLLPLSWRHFLIFQKQQTTVQPFFFSIFLPITVLHSELITCHLKKSCYWRFMIKFLQCLARNWCTGNTYWMEDLYNISRKGSQVVRCMFFNIRLPEFEAWPSHLLATTLWANVFTTQSLSVSSCVKLG